MVVLLGRRIGKIACSSSRSPARPASFPTSLAIGNIAKSMIMIMLQDFMDPWTFNQKNLMKCCKEFLLPGGKQIPFCAYNTVGYREQARAAAYRHGARTASSAARRPSLSAEACRVRLRRPELHMSITPGELMVGRAQELEPSPSSNAALPRMTAMAAVTSRRFFHPGGTKMTERLGHF